MQQNLHGFIIHLRRAVRRQPQVAWISQHAPCEVSVVDATDGAELTPAQRDSYAPGLYQPAYPFALRPGELGAFHSHRECWRRIVSGGHPAGLILEDDLKFDSAVFARAVGLAAEHGGEDSYVRFPLRQREAAPASIAQDDELTLIRPDIIALGAVGQLVGREAARRLLAATERFDRPVDTFLQMRWIHGVKVLSVWPSSLREVSVNLGGSLIQKKTPQWGAKLSREWKRFWYRRAVDTWSRKASGR
jgi:glycosyl transferase, family 25